jgi:hypothetical protein
MKKTFIQRYLDELYLIQSQIMNWVLNHDRIWKEKRRRKDDG